MKNLILQGIIELMDLIYHLSIPVVAVLTIVVIATIKISDEPLMLWCYGIVIVICSFVARELGKKSQYRI